MMDYSTYTDEQLTAEEVRIAQARDTLSTAHKAVRFEIDKRTALAKYADVSPAELAALAQLLNVDGGIASGERVGGANVGA